MRWEEIVAEASSIEIKAMSFDQEGSAANAAECYRRVAAKLLEAAQCVPDDHAVRKLLEQRAEEVSSRIAHLEGPQGAVAATPLDDQLRLMRLTTQGILASTLATTPDDPAPDPAKTEDMKIMGAAAAIGGATGLVLMGPLSAAALGAAAAYATTREDVAGSASRKLGVVGLEVADRAVDKSLKVAERALNESRRRLLEGGAEEGLLKKDNRIRVAAACGAIQDALPREKLAREAKRMRAKYPDRIPVICEKAPYSDLPNISRNKFVVPAGMLCGEFKYIVHKQVTQASRRGVAMDQTIYIFVNDIVPKTGATMAELYEQHKAEDGFLYVRFTAENTLGLACRRR